jgi:hypothetical protein
MIFGSSHHLISPTAALKWANELNGDGNELLWSALDAVAAKSTRSGRT